MDRELISGNRLISNYMQERESKRLKQRLKNIKQNRSQYSSVGLIKEKPRANSLLFQKNQEIQKKNAALFNRIASIIKKNPKVHTQTQLSMQKSRDTSILFHRKIQSSLEEQNKLIQKRLTSQKPTINNKLFYQQREKHMKYLKTMGRYPYILNRKINTEPDVNRFDDGNINNAEFPPISNLNQFDGENLNGGLRQGGILNGGGLKQLFRHQSLDFTILVCLDMKTDSNPENYVLNMPKSQFIEYLEESQYDYEKMISNLRLNDEGNVEYIREKQNKPNHTPKQQKELFKFRAQSTAYTSTGFKTEFRSNKRNIISKNENESKGNSKTDRKINKYHIEDKISSKKQSDVMSENKFAEINILTKDR